MRKIISKIAGTLLGLALAVGVGVHLSSSFAQVKVAEAGSGDQYTFSSTSDANADAGWSFTTAQNEGSAAPSWNTSNSELRLYPKNTITFSAKAGYTFQSAVFTNKFNYKDSVTISSWETDHGTITGFSNTLTSFTVSSINASSFTITLDGQKGNLGLKKVTITYSSSSSGTLESISLSGSLTKTSYTTKESWSAAGLVATGIYDDKSEANFTDFVTFSYYDSNNNPVASPAVLGGGTGLTLKVKATYQTFESNVLTFSVNVQVISYQNSSSLVEGEYFIRYGSNYFNGSISGGKGAYSTSQPDGAGQFTFTLIADDTWTVVNKDGNYLGIGTSTTSLYLSSSETTLEIEDGVSGGDGQSFKIKGASGRYMAWYADGSDFRTYTSGNIVMTLESTSAATFTITYNANAIDAEGSMSPTSGVSPQVAACTFTRDGYTFLRWNSQADGEGDDYAVGSTVSADITLYVIWEEYIAPIGGNVTMSGVTEASSATVNTHSAIKCGSGKKAGSMSLTLVNAGIEKIKVYVAGWKDENKTVNVSINHGSISPTSLSLTADSGISGSVNDFTLDGQESLYKFEFTISGSVPANTVITLTAAAAASNRFVVWGATDLFAETFAGEFNSNLTCDATGANAPQYGTDYSWSYFESLYTGLDSEERMRLQAAEYTKTGTGSSTVVTAKSGTVQVVAEAMARYDYIVGKYNPTDDDTSAYKNFIDRTVVPVAGAPIDIRINETNGNASTIIIVVVALTSITSIGVLLVIKRKRSLVK